MTKPWTEIDLSAERRAYIFFDRLYRCHPQARPTEDDLRQAFDAHAVYALQEAKIEPNRLKARWIALKVVANSLARDKQHTAAEICRAALRTLAGARSMNVRLNADNAAMRAAINRAGALAVQGASLDLIRDTLAEALTEKGKTNG